jgi:hypothetical protein
MNGLLILAATPPDARLASTGERELHMVGFAGRHPVIDVAGVQFAQQDLLANAGTLTCFLPGAGLGHCGL